MRFKLKPMQLPLYLIFTAITVAVVSAAFNAPAWMGAVAGGVLILAYVRFAYEVARAL